MITFTLKYFAVRTINPVME